jgi:hypothetical protein
MTKNAPLKVNRYKRPMSVYPWSIFINGRTLYRKRIRRIYFLIEPSVITKNDCVDPRKTFIVWSLIAGFIERRGAWKKAHARIDYCGIQSIDCLIDSILPQKLILHRAFVLFESTIVPSPHRCASRAFRLRRPMYSWPPDCGNPSDTEVLSEIQKP